MNYFVIADKLANITTLPEEKFNKNKTNECIKCEEYCTKISKVNLIETL